MIVKKSPQANLENKRLPLFFLGILFATAIVLSAFEWKTYEETASLPEIGCPVFLPDEHIFTAVVPKEKLKAPAPKKPNPDKIIIVDHIPEPFPDLDFPEMDEPVIQDINFQPETGIVEPEITMNPDQFPEFPGGTAALGNYLRNSLKFPSAALNLGISGTVYVTFVVNKKGEIENIAILRSVHPDLDAEAIRVVESMPHWKPGLQRGVPVKVQFNLPIKFTSKR